jgi:REP element-mobilizing transposase RayT
MPARNTIKAFEAPAFYHVYNRGAGGRKIFLDDIDRRKFMSLLRRHLVEQPDKPQEYPIYEAELVAYCLMGNHFHLLLYQEEDVGAISGLMRSLLTAYSMYFNLRHKSQGHLFQGVYKAARIDTESYLLHITRYIHLNPRTYRTYQWSSLRCYLGQADELVKLDHIEYVSPDKYGAFLEDYEDRHKLLQEIKDQLAL